MILKAVLCLKNNQFVLDYWSSKFRHILVDEFQDVDHNQMELINLLASKHKNLYVVGDPDQTIYSWRGADVSIINNLDRKYPNVETIVLNENYRSSQNILKCANLLISNNRDRIDKELYSNYANNYEVEWHSFFNSYEQGEYIGLEIKKMVDSQALKYSDIAVLYRSNYLSRSLENQLVNYQIPYRIIGGTNFYARSEIKNVLSYLKVALFEDDLAFLRVANVPKRKIGDKTLEKLDEYASKQQLNYYQAAKNFSQFNNFLKIIDSIKQDLDLDFETLMKKLLLKSGLEDYYRSLKEIERLENIYELIKDGTEYFYQNERASLADYLDHVSLYSETKNAGSDCVSLMTIHAAKGLEFKIVFIASFNDGILPNNRSMLESGSQGLEEERRLAYVAMTRAKERLICVDNRDRNFDFSTRLSSSRFLNECIDGLNYIDHTTNDTYKLETKDYRPLNLSIGQLVDHIDYGRGKIVAIDGDLVEIDFSLGFIKTLVNRDDILSVVSSQQDYTKGSIYEHPKYGRGVVLAIMPQFYKVSFPEYGIKQIKR